MRTVRYINRFFKMYHIVGIMIFVMAALLAPGFGFMENDLSHGVVILEEMLKYSKKEFLDYAGGMIYQAINIFSISISGYLHMLLPVLPFGIVSYIADELSNGYETYKKSRMGTGRYVIGNCILLFLAGAFVVTLASTVLLFVFSFKFSMAGFPVRELIRYLFRLWILTWIGGMLSYFILLLFRNKFYAFSLPILIFYFENEMFQGLFEKLGRFSVQGLTTYADWWSFGVFAFFLIALLGNGIFWLERRRKAYGN